MECLQNDPILQFNTDTLNFLRKQYDFENKKRIDEAIDILDQWIRKQRHFVKHDYERDYLEKLLIANKGSVERSKERIDKMCTHRTLMPHFFQDFDIKNDFKEMLKRVDIVVLPRQTNDHCRIAIIKNRGSNYSSEIVRCVYRTFIIMADYLKMFDYNNGLEIISDLRDVNLTDLLVHTNIMDLRQCFSVVIEGYGTRVKSIHYITTSKAIETLVSIVKQAVPDKIANRMKVHKTLDSLFESVPKDIMPKEYGGNEKPLLEIRDKWVDLLSSSKFREQRMVMNKACTDETAREKGKFNEEYLGTPGSFRSLVVD